MFNILFLAELRPGHTGFEQALQIAYGLAADGKTNKESLPTNLYHLALLFTMGESNVPGVFALLTPGTGAVTQSPTLADVVLIDWEWLGPGPAVLDVANILQRLPVIITPGTPFPISRAAVDGLSTPDGMLPHTNNCQRWFNSSARRCSNSRCSA